MKIHEKGLRKLSIAHTALDSTGTETFCKTVGSMPPGIQYEAEQILSVGFSSQLLAVCVDMKHSFLYREILQMEGDFE
jgi:hypothetical protein